MSPHSTTGRPDRLSILAVSKRADFLAAIGSALTDLTSASGRTLDVPADPAGVLPGRRPPAYELVLRRARHYLDRALPQVEISLIAAGSLRRAGELVAAEAVTHPGRQALALILVDVEGADVAAAPLDHSVDDALDQLIADLPDPVGAEISPYTSFVYEPGGHQLHTAVHTARRYALRHDVAGPWVVAADVICAFTDYVQLRHHRLAARIATGPGERTLARALHEFLHQQAGATWGLHYYTGSVVSGFIGDLERLARASANPVLRGPSEHSLACGALARWQLDQAPFLIVVTSGMVDEFRGVLANLRETKARGFIVCGEAQPGRWFPFQGTVHGAEDSREVLRARGIPAVHLDSPQQLAVDLESAFDRYTEGEGPVVLLATPEVLDATGSLDRERLRPVRASSPSRTSGASVRDDAFQAALHLINRERSTLLWQCGHLTGDEASLVHDVAHRAGIALADSLTRPGSVSRYRDGRVVEEYLGTLALYGYSSRVYEYLHREGRLKPRDEQCLFFLKSRIGEIATPFSERMLARALQVVQVTDDPRHRAPFADHAIIADAADFLRAVRERLDVDPDVLRWRREAIRATRDSPSDVIGHLPLRPMSANHFFRRLGGVLERLIAAGDYTYTGVYDVGRGGLSAVRNLPRTGPGYSGWYGRALMGDALQAVPALAFTRPGNILAFVGDGAAALVPDILPTIVAQATLGRARLAGNVSIFRLIDGGHSLIRTYREARQATTAGYQTALLTLVDDDWRRDYGPIEVVHRRLLEVEPVSLAHELRDPGTVNLYSVILAHNNEGDGLSPLASLGWQRDQVPELAFAAAGRPGAAGRGSR